MRVGRPFWLPPEPEERTTPWPHRARCASVPGGPPGHCSCWLIRRLGGRLSWRRWVREACRRARHARAVSQPFGSAQIAETRRFRARRRRSRRCRVRRLADWQLPVPARRTQDVRSRSVWIGTHARVIVALVEGQRLGRARCM